MEDRELRVRRVGVNNPKWMNDKMRDRWLCKDFLGEEANLIEHLQLDGYVFPVIC